MGFLPDREPCVASPASTAVRGVNRDVPFAADVRARALSRPAGFGLLELVVAIAAISILMYVLLDRIAWVQEMAEKTESEETVRSIETALRLEAASRVARGGAPDDLLLENPVRWLQSPPRNYLGELAADPRECRPACWYYLTRPRLLVYRPGRADHLTGARELRFRVVAEPGSGGLRLVPVRAYRWF